VSIHSHTITHKPPNHKKAAASHPFSPTHQPTTSRLSKVHAELQAIEASILDSRRAERAALRYDGVSVGAVIMMILDL